MSTNEKHFFENQNWDFELPTEGHEKRFLKKLKRKKAKKQTFWKPLAIACALVLAFGTVYVFSTKPIINQSTTVAFSPQVQETHDYFSSVIQSELKTLKQSETPKNKQIIDDALKQMEVLESDYENLKLEIQKNGENKQIVYAMITNLQTRIDFIKSVLDQVNILKKSNHENII